jgi:hypothetical protein
MHADLMLQSFWVARYQSVNARGDQTYATPEAHACRYEPSTRLLRTQDGAQAVSEAILYTATDVAPRDLVYPPGANPADYKQSRKPLRVERHFDLDSGQLAFVAVHI